MSVTALGKIVIVDKDENISSLLNVNLRSEGYDVGIYTDAREVLKADFSNVRLILADAMTEEFTALDLLREIKDNEYTAPIAFIVCSAVDNERIIIDALDSGADDYIVKPFSLRELVARSKAVIRRHGRSMSPVVGSEIKFHSLRLNIETGVAYNGDTDLKLTKTEFAITKLLLLNKGKFISRAEIYRTVWNDATEGGNDRTVDTNISRLRKKLGDLAMHLVNRSGLGYMMKE